MADNEQDTIEKPVEGQGEAEGDKATGQPQDKKPAGEAPEPSGDPLALKQGEKPEEYAARIKKEVEWRDKQLNRQHRKIKEADERLAKTAELEAQNKELQELATRGNKKPAETPQETKAPTPPGVTPEALAAARIQVGMERLGEELNKRKEWPDAFKNLERAGGIQPNMLSAVLDTDDPAHVMLTLGQDPNLYQQILDMPEGRQRAALVKLGMQTATSDDEKPAPRKPSGAPPPRHGLPAGDIGAPADGGFVPGVDDRIPQPIDREARQTDKFGSEKYDDAWYRERRRQKLESQGRPWSPTGKR